MPQVSYTKGNYKAEVSVEKLAYDRFQGAVLLIHLSDTETARTLYSVQAVSSSPKEALDEAKALAHRLLGKF